MPVAPDRRAAAGDAAADRHRVCDLARLRHSRSAHWRRALPAPGRHRDHGAGAGLLRHAARSGSALMAILLFSVQLDWLPSFGYETVGANYTGLAHVARRRRASGPAGDDHRPVLHGDLYPHDARLDARGERLDFVKTARAKGLSDTVIQRRHVLRNALLPVVTLCRRAGRHLVGGAVLTETVFAWPGIGRLMYRGAAAARLQPAARRLRRLLGHGAVFNLHHRPGLPPGRSAHRVRLMKRVLALLLRNPGGMIGAASSCCLRSSVALFGPLLFPTRPGAWCSGRSCRPFTLRPAARHRRARPRRDGRHHLRRARLAAGRPGLDAGRAVAIGVTARRASPAISAARSTTP